MIGFGNKKRKHFKDRLKGVYAALWDSEFQREKLEHIREGFRMEFDKVFEHLEAKKTLKELVEKHGFDIATLLIKAGPEKIMDSKRESEKAKIENELKIKLNQATLTEKDKEAIDNLSRQIEPFEADIKQLKSQIDNIDKGIDETNEKIQGLIELEKMVKEFMKKI